MNTKIVTKKGIMKLLNDWYVEIRSHHIITAKRLKADIDTKIKKIEPTQKILNYYSLLTFRFNMLIGEYKSDLRASFDISTKTDHSIKYYYHFFTFIYATEISNYSEAKIHLEQAEKLLTSIPDEAEKAEFNHRTSLFYYYIGQEAAAVIQATKAKEFFTNRPGYEIKLAASNNTIGMACIRLKQFEIAERHFNTALRILKEQRDDSLLSLILKTNYNLGLLYAEQNISEFAIRYLSESFEDEEKDYKTMFLLAREYFKIGNKEKASIYIKQGLKVCDKEYMYHFTILKTLNDYLPVEQLEEIVKKAIHYFKDKNLWTYIQDYAKELAIQFYHLSNKKKSSQYLQMNNEVKKILEIMLHQAMNRNISKK